MSKPKYIPLPPIEEIDRRVELSSDSPSGLRWRISPISFVKAGDVAGNLNHVGYWAIGIMGKKYLNHRIIFMMVNGFDPAESFVDHADNNSSNNSPDNLRLADECQNLWNSNAPVTKTSDLPKGVWVTPWGYEACLKVRGSKIRKKGQDPELLHQWVMKMREIHHEEYRRD